MTTLNPRRLGDALRAGACGIHPLEAGTGLLIDCGSWLHRETSPAGSSRPAPASATASPCSPASTGKPPSPPCTPASSPPAEENAGCSS